MEHWRRICCLIKNKYIFLMLWLYAVHHPTIPLLQNRSHFFISASEDFSFGFLFGSICDGLCKTILPLLRNQMEIGKWKEQVYHRLLMHIIFRPNSHKNISTYLIKISFSFFFFFLASLFVFFFLIQKGDWLIQSLLKLPENNNKKK